MHEINNIEDLMRALSESVEVPVEKVFYCQADASLLTIRGISPHESDEENIINLPIQEELAIKFLTGEENLMEWAIALKDEKHSLVKKSIYDRLAVNDRVDVLQMVEVLPQQIDNPDITIQIDQVKNTARIVYNGLSVQHYAKPIMLYFTREDDPTHLKMVCNLGADALSHMTYELHLSKWPEELLYEIADIDDTSIYTSKSQLKISLSKI